jgi:Chalcone isomerase-like
MSCNSHCAASSGLSRRALVAAIPAAALAAPAATWAAFTSTPPAEVSAALPGALLQGHGRLRYFGLHIYDAALWSLSPVPPGNPLGAALALEMRYARKLAGSAIADRSIAEMKRVGDFSPADGQRWLEAMKQAFPDVHAGDRITGVHRPGVGAAFFVNGKPTAEVRDAQFAQLFFGVWLSPQTSQPALRAALLGTAP